MVDTSTTARLKRCPSRYPVTGHQCELEPGHGGAHDRVISATWVTWTDDPPTVNGLPWPPPKKGD